MALRGRGGGRGPAKDTKAEKTKKEEQAKAKALEEEESARALALAEEERKKSEEDRREARQRIKMQNQQKRASDYKETRAILDVYSAEALAMKRNRWAEIQWKKYFRSDQLPDPLQPPQINGYLSRWREDVEDRLGDVLREIPTCLALIQEIEVALIEHPEIEENTGQMWRETVDNIERLVQEKLDRGTYNLLLECSSKMDPTTYTVSQCLSTSEVGLCLWANLSRHPRHRGHSFPAYTFQLPDDLLDGAYAVRFMYTSFDQCSMHAVVPTQAMIQAAPPAPPPAEGGEAVPVLVDPQGYSASGGLLHIDLLRLPPQAIYVDNLKIRLAEDPASLVREKYSVKVTPARPPPPGMRAAEAAEFTEAELKRYEQEMNCTVPVTIKLPSQLMLLDQPFPALWDPELSLWTTKSIFDSKYEEEKGTVSFKLGEFGILAVMQRRFPNLPYQSWCLSPEPEGRSVHLSLSGPLVQLGLTVGHGDKAGLCALRQLQYGEQAVHPDLCHNWMVPKHLFLSLSKVGIHLVPEGDAAKFLELVPKEALIEHWTYQCMSLMCLGFCFHWNRWNASAGSGCLVLRCTDPTLKEDPGFLVSVTSERAAEVKCNEFSPTYCEEIVDKSQVYGDLFHLLKTKADPIAKAKLQERTAHLVDCIFIILSSLKLFSFS